MTTREQLKLKRNKKASLSDQQNKSLLAFAKMETEDTIKQLNSSENGLNLKQIKSKENGIKIKQIEKWREK